MNRIDDRTRRRRRTTFELEVLRTTVYQHARSREDVIEAVVKEVYDRVLAGRMTSGSATMGGQR